MFAVKFLLLAAVFSLGKVQANAFVREFDDGDPAHPTHIPIEWAKDRTVLMHLSMQGGVGLSDGSNSFNEVAEAALNIWNQQLVHMKFAVNRNSILPPDGTDGSTSVTMADTVYGMAFGDNVLAVTLVSPRQGRMAEADVIFNIQLDWDSYRDSRPTGPFDLRRVALHEFGHVVGLDHPDQASPKQTVVAIMNSTVSNTIADLQTDDINGAHSIYDSGPAFQNSIPAPNLVNLSTRAFVGLGDNVVIGGFIVQGSQPATVVLRGIGGSLPALGLQNTLIDPIIELHSASGATLATSDDWIDDSWASTIASYHLDPTNSREAAILITLNPGSYTLVVRCWDDPNRTDDVLTGTALVELYDLHTSGGRAGNISTRGPVMSGEQVLIGGFIVGGSQTKNVVVRALGPSLANAGISGALSDPTVELHNASGSLLASNDNWQTGPNAAQIQSEGLAPTDPAESALQATLSPGSYTAIVRGANGATGVGLVEIYDLSPAPN